MPVAKRQHKSFKDDSQAPPPFTDGQAALIHDLRCHNFTWADIAGYDEKLLKKKYIAKRLNPKDLMDLQKNFPKEILRTLFYHYNECIQHHTEKRTQSHTPNHTQKHLRNPSPAPAVSNDRRPFTMEEDLALITTKITGMSYDYISEKVVIGRTAVSLNSRYNAFLKNEIVDVNRPKPEEYWNDPKRYRRMVWLHKVKRMGFEDIALNEIFSWTAKELQVHYDQHIAGKINWRDVARDFQEEEKVELEDWREYEWDWLRKAISQYHAKVDEARSRTPESKKRPAKDQKRSESKKRGRPGLRGGDPSHNSPNSTTLTTDVQNHHRRHKKDTTPVPSQPDRREYTDSELADALVSFNMRTPRTSSPPRKVQVYNGQRYREARSSDPPPGARKPN
ncbi:hypothetical protein ACMFMG_006023 [Clarireedia jacksonii]